MDEALSALIEWIGPFPDRAVSVLGVGPGDAALISVKAAVRLRQADVAFSDLGRGPDVLWNLLGPAAETIFLPGRRTGPNAAEIAEMIRPHVDAGRRVVFLTSGNPLVFERVDDVVRALSHMGITFEIVPGPTAALAAAAYAGIPVSGCDGPNAVCLGVVHHDHDKEAPPLDLAALARSGTLALYIGEDHLARLCDDLRAGALRGETPFTIVQAATRSDQRTISGTLDTIAADVAEAKVDAPAVIFVGAHAAPQAELGWFERRPLLGQRILLTRAWHQSATLAGRLNALGAELIEAPTITIEPPGDYAAMDDALVRLGDYDWLILTSANGVDALADRFRHLGLDARALAAVRIAAVGTATAERLEHLFIKADLLPERFVGEALAQAMGTTDLKGKRCLLLRSDIAGKTLPDMLTAAGARCDDFSAYRTRKPDALPGQVLGDLEQGRLHWAIFTSPSTFTNFVGLLGDRSGSILPTLKLASIGPVTSKTIRAAGYEPAVEAEPHTVEGLANTLAEYVTAQRSH